MITDFFITLALLGLFVMAGRFAEALHAAEARRHDYGRNARLNLFCTVFYLIADAVVGAVFTFFLARVIRTLPGAGLVALPTPERLTLPYVVGYTVVWLACTDFFCYWWHRLQHRSAWLWAQHELHHSEEHLNATSSYRHHWLEAPFKAVTVVAPLTYLLQPAPAIAPVVYLAGLGLTVFAHMNVRLGFGALNWILLTPQMHRIHHSRAPEHRDRNLAFVFPIWDVIFGTYYHPHPSEYPATGLTSRQQIRTFWQASAWPFLRWSGRV